MTIDPKNLAATATLTFDDEFNTFSIWNGTSGTWQTSYPWAPASGGTNASNHELEWYINPAYGPTNSVNPFSVTNGILTIEARPASAAIQSITGLPYTSGIITTDHSFSQTYGYFEMRAQLPTGQGVWPAFWLLPVDQSWPPEIDIMEVIGSSPIQLNTTVHYGNNQATGFVVNEPGMTTGFHTYGVDWEPDYITWYFDGNAVSKTATPAGMNKPMYMLANLAIGGDWPGAPNSSTPFLADMQIDYIRAYSSVPGGGTTPPPTPTPTPTPTSQHLFDLPTTAATTHLINGTSGNDVLTATSSHTYFDSWGGTDTMTGLGNDVFEIYSSKSVIKEAAGSGINTVNSGASSFVLPANVQDISLIGNGGNHSNGVQSATGNGLDNLMISNSTSYGNILNGNAGNDELIAGKGADTLTGGTGADEFVFKALPTKAGHVTDFAVGTDLLDLRGIFKTAGYTGTNPIADSHLFLTANASGGTAVYYDASGNPSGTKVLITTLDHVLPSALHLQSDIWFA